MKEEVAKQVLNWLQGSEEFVIEQAPKLVEEILLFGLLSNLFWSMAMFVVFGLITYWVVRLIKMEEDKGTGMAFFLGVPQIITLVLGIEFFVNLIQIWVAPRMYLIEYFKYFVQ